MRTGWVVTLNQTLTGKTMDIILSAWTDRLRTAGARFVIDSMPMRRPDVFGLGVQSEEPCIAERYALNLQNALPGSALYYDHASRDIAFLLETERHRLAGRKILELGCGTGILAIIAARLGGIVSACDIDSSAIELSLRNTRQAGLNIDLRLGDLGKPFMDMADRGAYFDWIIANLPHKPGVVGSGLPLSQAGGEDGVAVWERALKDILALTRKGSRLAFFMHSLPNPILIATISEHFDLRLSTWKLRYFKNGEYAELRESFRQRHSRGLSFLFRNETGEGVVGCTWLGIRR